LDFSFRYDIWYLSLTASPRDVGFLRGIVIRPDDLGEGGRKILKKARLTSEAGLLGDRWAGHEKSLGRDQVSLINVHVLESLAGKDPGNKARSGDNLQVDLDLSEANLPPGTRISVGSCVLEVSEQAHTPCLSFHRRFGKSSVRKVLRANKRGLRGRGVLCMVVQAGEIALGDEMRVLRDAPADN
jgi:MOSC domain-containing protein YiiM